MKKYAEGIRRCLFIAAAIILLFSALVNMQKAGPFQKNITLAGREPLLTGNAAAEIKAAEGEREDEICFTAWRERKEMQISDEGGLRKINVDVLELYGSSELLIPYGKILNEDDTSGCLLGAAAAEALFGNRDAAGLTLYYNNRLFTVRGILEQPENILIVENHENQEGFERITIEKMDTGYRMGQADKLTGRYGINAESVSLRFIEMNQILSLIPGKWSDFEGWKENIKEWDLRLENLHARSKNSLEILYLEYRQQGMLLLGGGIFCILAAGMRGKTEHK